MRTCELCGYYGENKIPISSTSQVNGVGFTLYRELFYVSNCAFCKKDFVICSYCVAPINSICKCCNRNNKIDNICC